MVVVLVGAWAENGKRAQEPAVTMPDLVGMSLAQATVELEKIGISWRLDGDDFTYRRALRLAPGEVITPSPEQNRVLAQDPSAGTSVDRETVAELRTQCGELAKIGQGCL